MLSKLKQAFVKFIWFYLALVENLIASTVIFTFFPEKQEMITVNSQAQ